MDGAGVRPNLAHLLHGGATSGPVISVGASEAAAVRQRAAAALREPLASSAVSARAQAMATTQRRTVTGLDTTVFHSVGGSQQLAFDLSDTTIEAYAPNGSGGFERIAATSRRADGTYAITGVPEGPHWLRYSNIYVWTDQAFIDWSSDQFGRADVVSPTVSTRLNFNAGNLSPWQATDSLAWVVPLHGTSGAVALDAAFVANAPRTADAALADFGIELGPEGLFGGLLDASKGDQAYLNQLVTQPATGVRTLARSIVLPALSIADGSTTQVTSGFLDIAQSTSVQLRWDRATFVAQAAAVHPGAAATSAVMGFSAFALPPAFGTPFDAYSLIEYDTLGAQAVDFGSLRYGNPFPADWNQVADGFVAFTARYLAPGASVPEPLERAVSTSVLVPAATRNGGSLQLAPGITPPRDPRINGNSLFDNQLAVGPMPTLSWTAPALGVPDYYLVRVLELRANGARSEFRIVARLNTADTSLMMPPDLLQAGHFYVITMAAVRSSSPITQPRRIGLPSSFATLMGSIVSP